MGVSQLPGIKMDRTKLILLMLIAIVNKIECNPSLIQNEIDIEREADLMRQVDFFKSAKNAADRDMHKWWAEYEEMMDDYKDEFNTSSICTDSEAMTSRLTDV